MWTDYYLKFDSREAYEAAVPPALLCAAGPDFAVDEVGTIFRNDTFEELEGYHVNLRLRSEIGLPAELAAFDIGIPHYPKRVFA